MIRLVKALAGLFVSAGVLLVLLLLAYAVCFGAVSIIGGAAHVIVIAFQFGWDFVGNHF